MNLFDSKYGMEFCENMTTKMAELEAKLGRAEEELLKANELMGRQADIIEKQTETIMAMRRTMEQMPEMITMPIVEQLSKANETLEKGNELSGRIIHIERESLVEAKQQTATQRASLVLDALSHDRAMEQTGLSMEQQSSILKGAQDWFAMAMPQQADKQHEEVLQSIISDEEMAMAKAEGSKVVEELEAEPLR